MIEVHIQPSRRQKKIKFIVQLTRHGYIITQLELLIKMVALATLTSQICRKQRLAYETVFHIIVKNKS